MLIMDMKILRKLNTNSEKLLWDENKLDEKIINYCKCVL